MTTFTCKAGYVDPSVKDRFQRHKSTTREFTVPEVSADSAPLAALIGSSRQFRALNGHNYTGIRFFNGHLYQLRVHVQGHAVTPDDSNAQLDIHLGQRPTEEVAAAAVEAEAHRYLVIDGMLFDRIPEPYILAGDRGHAAAVTKGPPPVSESWRCFAIGESHTAASASEKSALAHNQPLPDAPEVTVLLPEAFTYPTSAERVAAAQREAEAVVRRATGLLETVTPFTVHQAHTILMNAASSLAEHTGLDQFRQE